MKYTYLTALFKNSLKCVKVSRYWSIVSLPVMFDVYYAVLCLVFMWSPYPWSLIWWRSPAFTTFCRVHTTIIFHHSDITMGHNVAGNIHCDITMGHNIARNIHCDITMGNDITRDIHCDVTMSNDVTMCTCHDITMHKDIATNLYVYYVLRCLSMLFYYG